MTPKPKRMYASMWRETGEYDLVSTSRKDAQFCSRHSLEGEKGREEMNVKYINTRLLLRPSTSSFGEVEEVLILEVSPSGKLFKGRWLSGAVMWREVEDYRIVEVL